MKKLLLLLLVLTTLPTYGQKILEGSLPSLVGETKINVELDLTEARIDNKAIPDWLEYRQSEQPEYNAKQELETEFIPTIKGEILKAVNDKLDRYGAFAITNGSAKYTLLICPVSITKKGSNKNVCSILDENRKVLVKFAASGSGGHVGSMDNLFGDGYESSGKKIASFVAKCFKD